MGTNISIGLDGVGNVGVGGNISVNETALEDAGIDVGVGLDGVVDVSLSINTEAEQRALLGGELLQGRLDVLETCRLC